MHGCEAYNCDASAEGDDGSCEYETLIQVDMTGFPIDNAVSMWPALFRMESVRHAHGVGADSMYQVTVVAQVGTQVEYKFVNGNEWGQDEGVPEACGVPNGLGGFNGAFVVPSENTTLDVHCFASCVPCAHRHRMTAQEMSVAAKEPCGTQSPELACGWFPGRRLSGRFGSRRVSRCVRHLADAGDIWRGLQLMQPSCSGAARPKKGQEDQEVRGGTNPISIEVRLRGASSVCTEQNEQIP